MRTLSVKIINQSKYDLPSYATSGSAGMDLRANIETALVLQPMERQLVPTGLFMELPDGYEAQVRPRSGLAIKQGSKPGFGFVGQRDGSERNQSGGNSKAKHSWNSQSPEQRSGD